MFLGKNVIYCDLQFIHDKLFIINNLFMHILKISSESATFNLVISNMYTIL